MPVLGIIACRALEDELAHVIIEDSELRHLIIIDNLDSFGLSRKLRSKNRSHLMAAWKDIPAMLRDVRRKRDEILKPLLAISRIFCSILGRSEDPSEDVVIVVTMLKIALHIDNKLLRAEVRKNIERMSQFSDSILLFYGRCGNALQDIESSGDWKCPIFFLAGDSGEKVDDCVAAALGGNKQYGQALSSNQGVGYFCTPMWASTLDHTDQEAKKYTIEHHLKPKSFGDLLVKLGYTKIARLDTGLNFINDFQVESTINWFASQYNLEVVRLRGSVEIAERCYKQAKDYVGSSFPEKGGNENKGA
ncbi:MAG: hypothetical protein A4E48_02377 [Methanosaeta sp. PtaU1.Bin060]|nr:MAG: hypothetical protein A4E48_02377 [Methanosaeta sp. PtaU1.Bin060]